MPVETWTSSAEGSAEALPKRPLWQAARRGLACRCPACGKGRLFGKYLKPVATCEACGEDLSHQRADDAPPYFTIFIVGHIVVPLMLWVEIHYKPEVYLQLMIWLPLTLVLSLLLLQPIKGAVIGWQWAVYMHGFHPAGPEDVDTTYRPVEGNLG